MGIGVQMWMQFRSLVDLISHQRFLVKSYTQQTMCCGKPLVS